MPTNPIKRTWLNLQTALDISKPVATNTVILPRPNPPQRLSKKARKRAKKDNRNYREKEAALAAKKKSNAFLHRGSMDGAVSGSQFLPLLKTRFQPDYFREPLIFRSRKMPQYSEPAPYPIWASFNRRFAYLRSVTAHLENNVPVMPGVGVKQVYLEAPRNYRENKTERKSEDEDEAITSSEGKEYMNKVDSPPPVDPDLIHNVKRKTYFYREYLFRINHHRQEYSKDYRYACIARANILASRGNYYDARNWSAINPRSKLAKILKPPPPAPVEPSKPLSRLSPEDIIEKYHRLLEAEQAAKRSSSQSSSSKGEGLNTEITFPLGLTAFIKNYYLSIASQTAPHSLAEQDLSFLHGVTRPHLEFYYHAGLWRHLIDGARDGLVADFVFRCPTKDDADAFALIQHLQDDVSFPCKYLL